MPDATAISTTVDLRSDTVTRPTSGMREAIARAEVGDDVLGDDPTVRALEDRVATILGKEAALFFPSGIMANQTAILALTRPGTEAVIDSTGHIFDWEDLASAHWAGVQLRTVTTPDGILTPDLVRDALRPGGRLSIETSLILLENTHNAAGGKILPLQTLRGIRELARERGIPIHLDGARLWNAATAAGIAEATYAAEVDTVMVTLSKGLGCPIGSMLAGSAEVIEAAWRIRRRLGGGMRQAGILAAAGLYALEHHRGRLHEDHARARRLAADIAEVPGLRVVTPETNIIMIEITHPELDAPRLLEHLRQQGILMSQFGPRRVRAVTHLDIDDEDVDRAVAAVRATLAALAPWPAATIR
jgi:threonine aldolase